MRAFALALDPKTFRQEDYNGFAPMKIKAALAAADTSTDNSLPAAGAQGAAAPTAEEIESTAIDDNPSGHAQKEQKVIEAYKNSIDKGLLNWVRRVKDALMSGDETAVKMRHVLGPVQKSAVEDIKKETGIDATGFEHIIEGHTVKHIEGRHGADGEHDSTIETDEDFARMLYILNNYDKVYQLQEGDGAPRVSARFMDKNNRPAPMIRFEKKLMGPIMLLK